MACVVADLAEFAVGRSHPSVRKATKWGDGSISGGDGSISGGDGSISGGRRHFDCDCDCLYLMEALLVSDLRKNISIFFQMHRTRHIIIFFNSIIRFINPILETKMTD
jgi:hypothetical protein